LFAILEVIRPAVTRPGFENLVVVFGGWVLTAGTHAITAAQVASAVAGRRHHEAYHRFFSRGTWSPDAWGRRLLELALQLVPEGGPVRFAIDDTLAPKKGAHVFGLGTHIDAVRSTRKHRVFCFGHCWVIAAILVRVPFSERTWALPILFRLYRNKKDCASRGHVYRKKTELARDMIDLLAKWLGERRIIVTADVAYCNDTVTRDLAPSVWLCGAMRPDAVLTEAPPVREGRLSAGRPRKRGAVLRKPAHLARDGRTPAARPTRHASPSCTERSEPSSTRSVSASGIEPAARACSRWSWCVSNRARSEFAFSSRWTRPGRRSKFWKPTRSAGRSK